MYVQGCKQLRFHTFVSGCYGLAGIFGPLTTRMDAVDLDPKRDLGYFRQSVAFVVL
jgi:hypothetical protein